MNASHASGHLGSLVSTLRALVCGIGVSSLRSGLSAVLVSPLCALRSDEFAEFECKIVNRNKSQKKKKEQREQEKRGLL